MWVTQITEWIPFGWCGPGTWHRNSDLKAQGELVYKPVVCGGWVVVWAHILGRGSSSAKLLCWKWTYHILGAQKRPVWLKMGRPEGNDASEVVRILSIYCFRSLESKFTIPAPTLPTQLSLNMFFLVIEGFSVEEWADPTYI